MIGRAFVPRWCFVLLAFMVVFSGLTLVIRPVPAWQVAGTVGVLVLVLPVVVSRGDALVVRNVGLPRRVALAEVVGTHFEPNPRYMNKGCRLVLRLRNGAELGVNAVSHEPIFGMPRVPTYLLATVERLGLPAVEGVKP